MSVLRVKEWEEGDEGSGLPISRPGATPCPAWFNRGWSWGLAERDRLGWGPEWDRHMARMRRLFIRAVRRGWKAPSWI